MIIMKNISKYLVPVLITAMIAGGCKKNYLETSPSNAVTVDVIFKTTEGAQTALDGLYRLTYTFGIEQNGNHDLFGQKSFDLIMDLMGTDMVVNKQGYNWFNGDYRYTAGASPAPTSRSYTTWLYYYQVVNNANSIISNIDAAAGAQSDKDKIKGQALFMRAHSYFYLVNFLQHTYKGNETKPGIPTYNAPGVVGHPRGTVQADYDSIVSDLTAAETLLTGKSRRDLSSVDVTAVQALRARVALQMEDYATAATYAEKVIPEYPLMTNAEYQNGFNSVSSPEWIWGMQVISDQATVYAGWWSHMDAEPSGDPGGYASLGQQKKIPKVLYDQINDNDVRKTLFVAPGTGNANAPDYSQQKFRLADPTSWAGDYMYLSVAEMYLIDAEALVRNGQDAPGRTILETLIKNRYSAYSASGLAGTNLLNEILLQRRIELWGEGLSLFDIKRLKKGLNRPSGAGNYGSGNYDPITYTLADQDPKFLYRIPQEELDANKSMTAADQNP
jgi:hypothetical protein